MFVRTIMYAYISPSFCTCTNRVHLICGCASSTSPPGSCCRPTRATTAPSAAYATTPPGKWAPVAARTARFASGTWRPQILLLLQLVVLVVGSYLVVVCRHTSRALYWLILLLYVQNSQRNTKMNTTTRSVNFNQSSFVTHSNRFNLFYESLQ